MFNCKVVKKMPFITLAFCFLRLQSYYVKYLKLTCIYWHFLRLLFLWRDPMLNNSNHFWIILFKFQQDRISVAQELWKLSELPCLLAQRFITHLGNNINVSECGFCSLFIYSFFQVFGTTKLFIILPYSSQLYSFKITEHVSNNSLNSTSLCDCLCKLRL